MKLVHTSDWHLGRRFGEASLVDDQAHALAQVLDVCKDERADVLVVAGDVYDRAVPPIEALELLSDTLRRCARELHLPVVLIAGNHDGPERLGFGAELMAGAKVTLGTRFGHRLEPVTIQGVSLYVLPYLEPEVARAALGNEELRTHDAAVQAALADVHAQRKPGPAVLVGHMFAAGGRESIDSERPLSVGAAGQVAGDSLGEWSYVALGHLHRPQLVCGREHVRYSGSLLKYSFGEADQPKSVCVVEIHEQTGAARVRQVALTPRRDVVSIEGEFDALLADKQYAHAEPAWVEATYTDKGYIVDAAARLRARFPHLLAARPKQLLAAISGEGVGRALKARGDVELLQGFWAHVGGAGELETAHIEAFERALRDARAGQDQGAGLGVVE